MLHKKVSDAAFPFQALQRNIADLGNVINPRDFITYLKSGKSPVLTDYESELILVSQYFEQFMRLILSNKIKHIFSVVLNTSSQSWLNGQCEKMLWVNIF